MVWRIRIRKVRFPKLILHRGLEAFVDICLILFLKDQDPKAESRFSPKIMQIRCKPAGLEDKYPKTESGFCPKIMQIRYKPAGLEDNDPKTESGLSPKIMHKQSKPGTLKDQDPKSKISKINFALWIRGFYRHLFHHFFEASGSANWIYRFSPKIRQIRCKPGCLEDKDPKPEPGFRAPKSCEKHSKPGSLEDPDSKIRFPTLILHRGLDSGFCRHLSHPFSWSIRIRNLNL